GFLGVILVLMSNDVFEFSQTWISIAFVLWFLMLLVFYLGLVPTQRAIREGDTGAESRLGDVLRGHAPAAVAADHRHGLEARLLNQPVPSDACIRSNISGIWHGPVTPIRPG